MSPCNQDIRAKAKEKDVYLWQVADRLGYSDVYFSKLLRKELPAETKAKVFKVIDELKSGENLQRAM